MAINLYVLKNTTSDKNGYLLSMVRFEAVVRPVCNNQGPTGTAILLDII